MRIEIPASGAFLLELPIFNRESLFYRPIPGKHVDRSIKCFECASVAQRITVISYPISRFVLLCKTYLRGPTAYVLNSRDNIRRRLFNGNFPRGFIGIRAPQMMASVFEQEELASRLVRRRRQHATEQNCHRHQYSCSEESHANRLIELCAKSVN